MQDHLSVRAISGSAMGLFTAAAIAVPCYQEVYVNKACDLSTCIGSTECGVITTGVDDDVYITNGGLSTGRATKTAFEFLCYMTWTERDPQGNCTVPEFCNQTIDGFRASGAYCEKGPF